jgi:putative SOS response-associated peptidase YedK
MRSCQRAKSSFLSSTGSARSPDAGPAGAEHAGALQCLPDRSYPHDCRARQTVTEKPFFRKAFKRRPASGYYEWQDTSGGKQPWYFIARDGSPALTTAGLWDRWRDKATGDHHVVCHDHLRTDKFVGEVHDRMPVLLAEQDFEPWLSGAAGLQLLKPAPEDMLQRRPASKRVNSSKAPDG